jgi:hypothetical protein
VELGGKNTTVTPFGVDYHVSDAKVLELLLGSEIKY